MKGSKLGEFEELILLTVGILQGEAYGLGVQNHINETSSRQVNLSAVHASLNRLDEKGYVRSTLGAPSQNRGGKRKRLYELTPFGVKALAEMKKIRDELWGQLSPEILNLQNSGR